MQDRNKELMNQVEIFHEKSRSQNDRENYKEITAEEIRFKSIEMDYLNTIKNKDDIIKSLQSSIDSIKRKALLADQNYNNSQELLERNGRTMRDSQENQIEKLKQEITSMIENSRVKVLESNLSAANKEIQKQTEQSFNWQNDKRELISRYSTKVNVIEEANIRLENQINETNMKLKDKTRELELVNENALDYQESLKKVGKGRDNNFDELVKLKEENESVKRLLNLKLIQKIHYYGSLYFLSICGEGNYKKFYVHTLR